LFYNGFYHQTQDNVSVANLKKIALMISFLRKESIE